MSRLEKTFNLVGTMSRLKSLGLPIVVSSIIFCSQAIASIPDSVIDQHADTYFRDANPEMLNRQIQPNQTEYQKEWLAIRKVLEDRIVYGKVCYKEGYGYDVARYGETMQLLADAVFYTRHPELAGRKLRPGETELIKEWNSIARSFPPDNC